MNLILEVQNLELAYGEVPAVRDLSFDVAEGEIVTLIGANGAGKTTTLRAIREDEVSAASLGINRALWKAFAFGVGAAIAGLAGCFYPGFVGTLVPDAFAIVESFTMMAMVIVGGMGTMIGPVVGAIVLTFLPELLRGFGELRLMIYGLALTLVVLFMPGGIVQAWTKLKARIS